MQTVDVFRCICTLLAYGFVSCWSCNDGYFPDESKNCVKCPVNCQFCESNEYCLSCKNGYWGSACEQSCSACKADTSCDKTNGVCVESCKDGYTGVLCDSICNERCSSCNRTNAQICLGCAHGWYPPVSCNRSCPDSCNNSSCTAKDLCTNGCNSGFYGQLCELRCSENCRENLCYQDNGTCVHGCEVHFTGTNCDAPKKTGNSATVVVVVVVVLVLVSVLVLVAVIAVLIVVRRKRRQASKNQKPEEAQEMLPPGVESGNELTNPGSAKKEKTEDSSKTQAAARNVVLRRLCFCFKEQKADQTQTDTNKASPETQPLCSETEPPVPVKKTKKQKLQELVDRIKSKKNEDFDDEFCKLPEAEQKSHDRSLEKENATDMEKEGVFPYDENIVTVRGRNGEDLYVNASFIKDEGGNTYIASRAPRKSDGPHRMWRLLWEKGCTTVVMLETFEKGEKEKYWPNKKQKYDKISVSRGDKHKTKLENEDCIIRLFTLEEAKESKVVKQLQYTGWPEREVPDKHSLLAFITRVRDAHLEGSGPIVVHGRRGVGRTGTFIALDMLMKEVDDLLNSDDDKTIDVFHCVKTLRKQRTLMVENIKQYKFLHEALQQYAENLLQKYQNERNKNTETPEEKNEENTETPKEKNDKNTETRKEKDERNTEPQKENDARNTERTKEKAEGNTKTTNESKETRKEKDERNTKTPNEIKETPKGKDETITKRPNKNRNTLKEKDEGKTKTRNKITETPIEKDDKKQTISA